MKEKVDGPENPDTLGTRNNLANTLSHQGKYAEAETEYREVLKLDEKVLGAEHPETLLTWNGLGNVLDVEGRYAEAEKEDRAVFARGERNTGSGGLCTAGGRRRAQGSGTGTSRYYEV